jgi:hypothetical protein
LGLDRSAPVEVAIASILAPGLWASPNPFLAPVRQDQIDKPSKRFSRFGKLPIFGRFVPQIISPIHATRTLCSKARMFIRDRLLSKSEPAPDW